jgi:predicted ABC-type sugar transport system permease subunit
MERGKRTILEMRNVLKTYGGSRALRSASLKIREAEIHSLTGSILAASSMLGLIVSLVPNYSFLGFEACLFTGLVLGLTNGALIAFLRLPPFIVTLGSLTAVRGVARLFSNDRTVFNSDLSFAFIGSSEICWTWNDSLDFVIAKQSILCIVGNVLSALGLT